MRFTLSLFLALTVIGCNARPLTAPITQGPRPDAGGNVDQLPDAAGNVNQLPDAGGNVNQLPDAAAQPVVEPDSGAEVAPPPFDAGPDPARDGSAAEVTSLPCPACELQPSCVGGQGVGVTSCGQAHESCCTSLLVPGGTFYRSYDGVSCPGVLDPQPIPFLGCYQEKDAPATVSAFRLDKYLVTVARFRRFIDAFVAGWRPPAGAGRHEHLNGGKGLVDLGAPGSFEPGWDPAWTAKLPQTRDDWERQPQAARWSTPPSDDDDIPAGGLLWAEAYAFCIWDGGFLPSEAEWNYAAAGGDEQRVYPWSTPPTSTALACGNAAFTASQDCGTNGPLPVGSRSPAGDGRWGQTDLVGNMDQWGLDWLADYVTPSVDGAQLQVGAAVKIVSDPFRVLRGLTSHGAAAAPPYLVAGRDGDTPWDTYTSVSGVRCARAP